MRPPNNAKEAEDLIEAAEQHHKQSFVQFREDERYYDGDFGELIELPEGYELTLPSTLRAIVDEAVDNVMPYDFAITYKPRGNSRAAEKDADTVRLFCKSVLQYWRENTDVDPIRDMGKNAFVSGLTAGKLEPDWTLWPVIDPEEEKELKKGPKSALKKRIKDIKAVRDKHFPMVFRSLPPRSIIVDDSVGGRKLWAIERYELNASGIQSMYAEWEPDFRDWWYGHRQHTVHEVFTAQYTDERGKLYEAKRWIFIDRKLPKGFPEDGKPHTDVDLPIKWRYSGYGRSSYEGRPEQKAVGFYTKQIKSLGNAEARRMSQLEAIVAQLAFPIGLLPAEVDVDEFDLTPGAVNAVPEKVLEHADKFFLRAPIPDRSIMASLDNISAQIQRGSTQEPLRGSPIPGTDSAAQYSLYTQQAKLRISSVQHALEAICSWAVSHVLRYIDEEFKSEVSVPIADKDTLAYAKLGPQNIQGHYDVKVEFMPSDEQVKERKLALASDAIVKGGMSPYDALEFAGFDNAQEIIDRKLAWDILMEPEIKRAIGKDILKEWGLEADEVKMGESAEQIKMAGMLQQMMAMMGQGPPSGESEQDPEAALAQRGQGPMALPVGSPAGADQMSGGPNAQRIA